MHEHSSLFNGIANGKMNAWIKLCIIFFIASITFTVCTYLIYTSNRFLHTRSECSRITFDISCNVCVRGAWVQDPPFVFSVAINILIVLGISFSFWFSQNQRASYLSFRREAKKATVWSARHSPLSVENARDVIVSMHFIKICSRIFSAHTLASRFL